MSAVCKGCGREILFAKNFKNGKVIPVEECMHVYRDIAANTEGDILVEHVKDEMLYISHFITCKNANDFSKKNEQRDN